MSNFKIIGNPNPVVGVLELYTVSDFFEKAPSSPFNKENSFSYDPVYWEVYVLEWGRWRKTKENDKSGNKVSYTFLEKSLTRNGIRILVKKGEKVARLDIKPLSAKPKIDHIELLDKNGAQINGRLSYGQTVKARVFCLNMEKRRICVTMWEDDVKGAGHNKANEKNYIETLSGIVKFGKADINFLLKPSFAKIAERGGHEKDKIHEFYVTAEYNDGKIASNNININALETPVAPYKGKTTPQQPVKNKPAEQKPKNDSHEPTSSKAVKGKISAVHITDTAGNQIKGIFKEKQIKVWISSTGLPGKEVCLKLYDEDLVSNDLLFTENFTIKSDLHAIVVPLDAIPRSLGGSNWAEGNEQELFAEIEVLQTHDFVKSAVVDVDATVFKQDPVETTNKVLTVNVPKVEKNEKENICECKSNDLIWGNKVSCEFRKKVVEISKRLGKDPNLLMAAMALETGRTFSPTAGKGSSYVGLIQFGDDAAESIGTSRDALLKMTAIQQLDYVEKYLEKKKSKLVTLTDFYLSILMPVDIGKGSTPNHVVFDNEYALVYKNDGKTLTDLSKSRHFGYRQNPGFFYEEGEKEKVKKGGNKKYDGEGKTYIWEIEEYVKDYFNNGKNNKTNIFTCNKDEVSKPNIESGTWNVIITEKYTGKKCTHDKKQRKNCRRGTIEIFDHNKNLVLTISDCLMEGWKGEDRTKNSNDTPFGMYNISSSPFKSGGDRIAYGPNPRLVFEPIKGSGDEIDKSGRSEIRIHGGRQEEKGTYLPLENPKLLRTSGCIRVFDADAKRIYDWWLEYHKINPTIKPGKVKIIK
ncbi:L,D-transpeptidase [Flavobacterium daemonense]|uniref:L,D-transpeptidase n=1 Tax=Flavobacterium daemonense TaxID=1393049 RepID=UPI001184A925|nr:L,D-transpeptidase [Flavobacterium daemonense]KAF2327715.1 murein L,D-transpeptidase [Flavobacterium daemonense]